MADPKNTPENTENTPPENQRRYIFSEAQTRLMFMGSGVLMVSTIVGILLLATSQPQGQYLEPNRAQYLSTITQATEELAGGEENADGTVTIPIERAMELVVERGVADPFTAGGEGAAETGEAEETGGSESETGG